MRPRRFQAANTVLHLPGGNEDNDLWVEAIQDEAQRPCMMSVWEPSPEERQEILDGNNLFLIVWGNGHPPVAIGTINAPLGKRPSKSPTREASE